MRFKLPTQGRSVIAPFDLSDQEWSIVGALLLTSRYILRTSSRWRDLPELETPIRSSTTASTAGPKQGLDARVRGSGSIRQIFLSLIDMLAPLAAIVEDGAKYSLSCIQQHDTAVAEWGGRADE